MLCSSTVPDTGARWNPYILKPLAAGVDRSFPSPCIVEWTSHQWICGPGPGVDATAFPVVHRRFMFSWNVPEVAHESTFSREKLLLEGSILSSYLPQVEHHKLAMVVVVVLVIVMAINRCLFRVQNQSYSSMSLPTAASTSLLRRHGTTYCPLYYRYHVATPERN